MSVPLPTPSPLSLAAGGITSSKPIPRSRPTPISTNSPRGSPGSPGISMPVGLGGSSNRRPSTAAAVVAPASAVGGRSFADGNWRERGASPSSLRGVNGNVNGTQSTATLGAGSASATSSATANGSGGRAPERTVGGFEKREIKTAGLSASSGLSREREKEKKEVKDLNDDKNADSKATLSHVPCRFFKAGACTAGDSCQFSHAAPDSAKREVCQWFLKGNCKFGHKCALAHVRPGEPISMDRKNKKAAQLETRDRADSLGSTGQSSPGPAGGLGVSGRKPSVSATRDQDDHAAAPVPIKSALSSSIQSPRGERLPSSPLREPFGPPSGGLSNSPSAGFNNTRSHAAFASSPSRPSPLSASFGAGAGAAGSVPGPLSLRASMSGPLGSPLRPPVTAGAGVFSSSFSQPSLQLDRGAGAPPLSASFAGDGGNLHKSIWARSDGPAEPLSPRRPIPRPSQSQTDVFVDEEEHGEDFLPSSLSDLLTPRERARRLSRRDSNDEFSGSPGRAAFLSPAGPWSGERLAQSAGATMGPAGFLQGLWSADGEDARKQGSSPQADFTFGPSTAQPQQRTSLLTQQRSPTQASPTSPIRNAQRGAGTATTAMGGGVGEPYLIRNLGDPSSPSSRALQEHAPGQSLPGGLASALSRLHLHGPRSPSGLGLGNESQSGKGNVSPINGTVSLSGAGKREEHDEEFFAMDG